MVYQAICGLSKRKATARITGGGGVAGIIIKNAITNDNIADRVRSGRAKSASTSSKIIACLSMLD
jgi:hypothetical protein